MRHLIDPIDKPALLIAVMRAFQGDSSYISLEGDLSSYQLEHLEHASSQESDALKRQTLLPVMDLLVVPLSETNVGIISKVVTRKDGLSKDSGLIHVQISKNGQLVFGGYDNFHSDCVFVEGLSHEALVDLKAKHILRSFDVATDA